MTLPIPGPIPGTRADGTPRGDDPTPITRQDVARWTPDAGMTIWAVGECNTLLAREPLGPRGALRWHLSISHPDRYPTWDEIVVARYRLLPHDATFAMLLPPPRDYVNAHPTVFHLHETEDR